MRRNFLNKFFWQFLWLIFAAFLAVSCATKKNSTQISDAPNSSSTWGLQYNGAFEDKKRDFVILDLWGYDPKTLPKTSKYIAYFSMHYEEWRPDAKEFKPEWLGQNMAQWPGEKLIKEDKVDSVIPIMKKRIELAKEKGFIGIDLDNLDQLPKDRAISYWQTLTNYAKSLGLIVGQKNASQWNSELNPDFYVIESCVRFNECDNYRSQDKPIFAIEYDRKYLKKTPGIYLIIKDQIKMDQWDEVAK